MGDRNNKRSDQLNSGEHVSSGNPSTEEVEDESVESSKIFQTAIDAGVKRLNRPALEMGASGVIAGMSVTFGALAAAAVSGATIASFGHQTELFANLLGAVVFPIGFLFVVIGRSELFTENFLVPTTSVIVKRARISLLFKLWGLTLIGNLIGAMIIAKVISLEHYHGVPAVHTVEHIRHMAEFLVLERDWDASFYAGVFAGWLITLMTWLLIATKSNTIKVCVIWCVGFLIMLNKFNHVVVNSSEILMAIFIGSESITYGTWLQNNFIPTLLGNMVGGLVFVTLLEYIKVMKVPHRWH